MSKQIWGNACWYLFHALAEKLKPESDTPSNIQTILFHFKQICFNLPCPSCQEHAIKTLEKVNFNNIKNKSDLKTFFWEFHNIVNKRINKPIFSRDKLDDMYSKAIFINIVNRFITVMKSKDISTERTMMNTISRHLCVDSFAKYIRENGYSYNP